jgi:hypothetical protein
MKGNKVRALKVRIIGYGSRKYWYAENKYNGEEFYVSPSSNGYEHAVLSVRDGRICEDFNTRYIRKEDFEILGEYDLTLEYKIVEIEPDVMKYRVVYYKNTAPSDLQISESYYENCAEFSYRNPGYTAVCCIPTTEVKMKRN